MTRAGWLELMRPLREQGMTHKAIAEELGCHPHKVADCLSDPDGAKARERRRRHRQSQPPLRFPIDRVRPILNKWLASKGTVTDLERASGINARQIYAILNDKDREFVTLNVVDALLCGIGRTDLFHTDLADIYEERAA